MKAFTYLLAATVWGSTVFSAGAYEVTDKSEVSEFDQTLQTIADETRDPSSVQFRRVRRSAREPFICGEINAKNGYGGYIGFKPFGFNPAKNETLLLAEPGDITYELSKTTISIVGCLPPEK